MKVRAKQDVRAHNTEVKFREAFEGTSLDAMKWKETKAVSDLAFNDGNCIGSSYRVISLSPWNHGTETSLQTIDQFTLPSEIAVGLHTSQRSGVGQEFAVEIVDTHEELPPVSDLAISSISQATTTLSVTTTLPHGLVVGKSIGIYDVTDSRLNFPQLVVATTPTATTFTCTQGPMGAIASATIGPIAGSGFVYFRERLGRANDGTSMIIENATATNASFYVRSASGDALPSGTAAANHSATISTTASVQPVNAALNYSFQPTSEYIARIGSDFNAWGDIGVDASNVSRTSRFYRRQTCPNPESNYRLRFRAVNLKGMSKPVAAILSIAKTGTTTATVTTDRPHGLNALSNVQIYGVRDQTSFPNLTAQTVVASIVSPTQFTIVIGTALTVTSNGGYVFLVNGNQVVANSGGAITQSVQTITASGNVITLVGLATWAGALIGDNIELIGVVDGAGVSLGYDGAYRIRDIQTTSLFLEPIDGVTRADIVTTNCGGGLLRRTELRLSYVRVFDYERLRIESQQVSSGDVSGSLPVTVNNSPAVTVSSGTITTVTGVTTVAAVTSANLGIPTLVADVASAAITTTATTAAVTPTFGIAYQVVIPVTVVTGTSPTMDVRIEESDDNGTNWYTVYDLPRITAVGVYRSPNIGFKGNRVRYVQTIGGTTPSFTRSINRNQSNYPADIIRQLVDRTVTLTTLNSVTPTLLSRECGNTVQLVINVGAITTTAPALQLEGSDDFGATWYAIGTPLTAVASNTVQVTVSPINAGAIRARVSTAGVGVTAGYVAIKCHD